MAHSMAPNNVGAPNYGAIVALPPSSPGAAVGNSHDEVPTKKRSRLVCLGMAGTFLLVCMAAASLPWDTRDPRTQTIRHGSPSAAANTTTSTATASSSKPRRPSAVRPLSLQSPEADLGFMGVARAPDAQASAIWKYYLGHHNNATQPRRPLPTNSWYQNLVAQQAARPHPSAQLTRAYTVPYIVDASRPYGKAYQGLRIHWPILQASSRNLQMVYDATHGLLLGTSTTVEDSASDTTSNTTLSPHYFVAPEEDLSLLGVNLQWRDAVTEKVSLMKTSLVRGMPLISMRYSHGRLPALAAGTRLASPLKVDGGSSETISCGVMADADGASTTFTAQREVMLHFQGSDFSWAVFFNRPVQLQCWQAVASEFGTTPGGDAGAATPQFALHVVAYERVGGDDDAGEEDPLVVQVALVNQCTTGHGNIQQHCLPKNQMKDGKAYLDMLRKNLAYPKTPTVEIEYPHQDDKDSEAVLVFDWDAQTVNDDDDDSDSDNLLMFALPHHQEQFDNGTAILDDFCIHSFHGKTCIAQGNKWTIKESLGKPQSFVAARPPAPWAIPDLADALAVDIAYLLSDNLMRGAADTYFTGKLMARLGRVVEIAMELKQLAASSSHEGAPAMYDDVDPEQYALSVQAAKKVDLPTDQEIQAAVKQIKEGVQIWLNGEGEAPYVYDRTWGGFVNCGCTYEGKRDTGTCTNVFPDCPALSDVNVDFGNGYYNDHHFHYGYHVFAAAVAAKHDHDWGRTYFEKVMLYIRDIANPSVEDEFFTQFRQKDWFLGSSWASGIVSGENSPHGRNEESSSEAIAAYEAMALYGAVMVDVFRGDHHHSELQAAEAIRDAGELLTASEVRAANRYWHVWDSPTHNSTYPKEYTQPVVGMLYQTMASFQTWFGPEPFYSYGIQLLPLTAVGERRDDPDWASLLYPLYDKSCRSELDFCVDNGWTIIQYGLLATTGRREEALQQTLLIAEDVFASQGGLGNSRSNTIWYISTRRPIETKEEE